MQVITHKRGDTFSIALDVDLLDNAAPLDDLTVRAQLRRPATGALVCELHAAVQSTSPAAATVLIGLPFSETESWPAELLHTDIQLTWAGLRLSTETIGVQVVGDITHA